MKKVLILSCSTGQGHNSCAQAVEDHFTGEGVACVRKDALDFISPAFSRFISWGHSWVYRHLPGLFRWGYRFSEKHPGVFRNGSAASRLLASGAEDLYAHIQAEGYDTVVCTHVFAGIMLTHMRRRHAMALQTAFVATDYTCSPGVADGDMDHYFIPDEALREEFLRCGVPAERITPSGIPLRRQFEKQTEKADAKRLLGLRAEKLHLLVMCGSMGCGSMVRMVRALSERMTENMEVSVICGTNRRLEKRLARRYGKNGAIHICGYTDEMPLYLDAADLCLTKPGGISVTEAAKKRRPMAFVNAVAGCESYNMGFFLDRGCAVTAGSPDGLAEVCVRVLNSPWELARLERALDRYSQPSGGEVIFETMCGGNLLEKRKSG